MWDTNATSLPEIGDAHDLLNNGKMVYWFDEDSYKPFLAKNNLGNVLLLNKTINILRILDKWDAPYLSE